MVRVSRAGTTMGKAKTLEQKALEPSQSLKEMWDCVGLWTGGGRRVDLDSGFRQWRPGLGLDWTGIGDCQLGLGTAIGTGLCCPAARKLTLLSCFAVEKLWTWQLGIGIRG
jgi:hypothetical protein